MSCSSCSKGQNGTPTGCQNKGHCTSGSCNKMNTYDWLSYIEVSDYEDFDIVEISFKNGARKGFYRKPHYVRAITGDVVVVETPTGYDMGRISLSGELVKLQMKKRNADIDGFYATVIRIANERDLEKLQESRTIEKEALVKARVIARSLDLDMKLGDVEFQGDLRKATFYYTADGRVDFRELIKMYAKEFRIKVEMRQIGARQESARVGGLGSCGRELCCSTWLTDFKSVTTTTARYQNLAINQSKISGQCGRLKCCLNYELDIYIDALKGFPRNADFIHTALGTAELIKTDIFKKNMHYIYRNANNSRVYVLTLERAAEIKQMNLKGQKPADLIESDADMGDTRSRRANANNRENKEDMGFVDGTGQIELPTEKRKKKGSSEKAKNNPNNANKEAQHTANKEKPTPPKELIKKVILKKENKAETNDKEIEPPKNENTPKNENPPKNVQSTDKEHHHKPKPPVKKDTHHKNNHQNKPKK